MGKNIMVCVSPVVLVAVVLLFSAALNAAETPESPAAAIDSRTPTLNNLATVYARIFLQGAYISNQLMRINLRNMPTPTNAYLPKSSPYPEAPKTIASLPARVTDWILLSLRSRASGPDLISVSAFVREDGMVVSADDGLPGASLAIPSGSYFIVIRHRNHLSVMSKQAVDIAQWSATTPYDFATASTSGQPNNRYYKDADDGAVQLRDRCWAMAAADGSRGTYNREGRTYMQDHIPLNDGSCDASDAVLYDDQQGKEGYVRADYSLDSSVDAIDAGLYDANQGREAPTVLQR
jgi:hypothetical protein